MLSRVRPRDVAGKMRRRMAGEQLKDLVAVDAKLKKPSRPSCWAAVLARGSHLMDLHGVGPITAARILADVGDIARFADRNRFASWTGTAPLNSSPGRADPPPPVPGREPADEPHAIHIAAIVQLRHDAQGRAYYFFRKTAAGKTRMEATALPQTGRISDAIYRQRVADARRPWSPRTRNAGPGGRRGASLQSSAAGSHPHTGTSDQPLPGPAPSTLPAATQPEEDHPPPARCNPAALT